LGLKNISFKAQDVTHFDRAKYAGAFDYIICHGVYSWVDGPVRAAIMALIRDCLAPQGLTLVSYNTLPGWNAVRSLREMMIYHTSRFDKPQEKVAQARAFLNFLSDNVGEERAGYKALIEEERAMLSKSNDSY